MTSARAVRDCRPAPGRGHRRDARESAVAVRRHRSIRSASSHPDAAALVRETVTRDIGKLAAALTDDQPETRAVLGRLTDSRAGAGAIRRARGAARIAAGGGRDRLHRADLPALPRRDAQGGHAERSLLRDTRTGGDAPRRPPLTVNSRCLRVSRNEFVRAQRVETLQANRMPSSPGVAYRFHRGSVGGRPKPNASSQTGISALSLAAFSRPLRRPPRPYFSETKITSPS